MVGVNQLAVAELTTVFPLPVVVATGSGEGVSAGAVFTSMTPLSVVHVAVHVRVFTLAVTLVSRPLTCKKCLYCFNLFVCPYPFVFP